MSDRQDLQQLLRDYATLDPERQARVRQRAMSEARQLRAEAFRDLFRRLWAWVVRRAAAARLRALDDRMLKDIGLHRSEIEAAVNGRVGHRAEPAATPVSCLPKGKRAA